LDKSALVRGASIDGAYSEPCLCAITRLEMLYSARSARAYEELEVELDTFHQLRVDAETIAIALPLGRPAIVGWWASPRLAWTKAPSV
jgi:predicted nucleic acid-binding protein